MKINLLPVLVLSLLICAANILQAQGTVFFEYTGGEQSYIVPSGVTKLLIKAWGGGGGGGFAGSIGGGGGGATAFLNVTPGQVITVRVGGGGRYSSQTPSTWVDWPSPGAGLGVYGDGGDTWVVGCGGQGGGRTEILAPDGSRLVAGGGGGASDGNTGFGVLHGDGGGNANYLASGPAGEAGQISTGGGGGGGWVGGAQGHWSRGGGGGQSGVSGSFYGSNFQAGSVWTSGLATDPDCAQKGYGGPSGQDGTAGRVVIAPLLVTSAPEISASVVTHGQPMGIRPRGSAGAGVSWSENVIWKPNGQAVVLGNRYGVDAVTGEISYTPDAGPGVYLYQCRVVDIYQNYADGWISFTVNGPNEFYWVQEKTTKIQMKLYKGNSRLFTFRLGGGGCIEGISDASSGSLLAGSFQGESTDRVSQWVLWNKPVEFPAETEGVPDATFNENQAGAGDGTFSPIHSVSRTGNVIDVYATPRDQYFSQLTAEFSAVYPSLARYELLADGVLKVRRVILTTAISDYNFTSQTTIIRPTYNIYFEQWTPFLATSAGFNAYSMDLNMDGSPATYVPWSSIRDYEGLPASASSGYAMIFQDGQYASRPVIGMAISRNEVQIASGGASGGLHPFNFFHWDFGADKGLAINPALILYSVPSGSIIDYTFYLVPREHADGTIKSVLEAMSNATPAPIVYGPGHSFSGELAGIVNTLQTIRTQTGTRTNDLGSLSN